MVRLTGQHVVGANDGGITAGIPAGAPAFFKHRNIAHAMVFGEIIGGRQAMQTAADYDHIVGPLRRGIAHARGQFWWPDKPFLNTLQAE